MKDSWKGTGEESVSNTSPCPLLINCTRFDIVNMYKGTEYYYTLSLLFQIKTILKKT